MSISIKINGNTYDTTSRLLVATKKYRAPPIVFGEYISLSALLISILLKAGVVVVITVAVGIPTQ